MLITSTFNKFYLNFYLNIKSGIKQISCFTPLFHSVKLFLLYDYFFNSTQIFKFIADKIHLFTIVLSIFSVSYNKHCACRQKCQSKI